MNKAPVPNNGGKRHSGLYTAREIANFLKVDEETVRRWIRDGVLPAVKLPKMPGSNRQSIRITQETLNRLLEGKNKEHGS